MTDDRTDVNITCNCGSHSFKITIFCAAVDVVCEKCGSSIVLIDGLHGED